MERVEEEVEVVVVVVVVRQQQVHAENKSLSATLVICGGENV